MKHFLFVTLFLLLNLPFIQCRKAAQAVATPPTASSTKSSAALNGLKNSISSGMAAACAKTLLAPFDTIKTIQQQSRNGGKALGMAGAANVIMSRPGGFFELYVSS
jgi:hypothetical protein